MEIVVVWSDSAIEELGLYTIIYIFREVKELLTRYRKPLLIKHFYLS